MTGILLVACAAAFGAACRYLVDFALSARLGRGFPWGTFVVNVAGSFALGLLLAAAAGGAVGAEVRVVVGVGFLGSFTTFSTWMYESVRLWQEGAYRQGTWNVIGSVFAGVAAAASGYAFGAWLFPLPSG